MVVFIFLVYGHFIGESDLVLFLLRAKEKKEPGTLTKWCMHIQLLAVALFYLLQTGEWMTPRKLVASFQISISCQGHQEQESPVRVGVYDLTIIES